MLIEKQSVDLVVSDISYETMKSIIEYVNGCHSIEKHTEHNKNNTNGQNNKQSSEYNNNVYLESQSTDKLYAIALAAKRLSLTLLHETCCKIIGKHLSSMTRNDLKNYLIKQQQ